MIYYVSNNGIGLSSDINTPGDIYETIDNIINADEIICLPGEYMLSKTIHLINENDEKQIIFRGLNFKERPIFNFVNQPSRLNGIEVSGNNIHIQDIIVYCAGYKGIVLYDCSNCELLRIESSYNQDSGIQLYHGSNIIKDCDSHHNFGYKNKHIIANYGFSSDGFSDKLYKGEGNTFINCRSWSNTDDGFDFFGRENNSTVHPSKLIGCWAFFNGRSKWNMEKHPRYQTDKEWLDQFKTPKLLIGRWKHYIKVQLNEFPAFGNGNGFKLSGNNGYNNIEVIDCIAAGNKLKGFDQNSNKGSMYIKNGISYKNHGLNFGFYAKIKDDSLIKIENCISSNGEVHFNDNVKNSEFINNDFESNLEFDIYDLMKPRKDDGSLPNINL